MTHFSSRNDLRHFVKTDRLHDEASVLITYKSMLAFFITMPLCMLGIGFESIDMGGKDKSRVVLFYYFQIPIFMEYDLTYSRDNYH